MTTIQIAHESASRIPAVEALLSSVAASDPNWNGAEFSVEIADFTCIPDDDSADAVALLRRIFETLDEAE